MAAPLRHRRAMLAIIITTGMSLYYCIRQKSASAANPYEHITPSEYRIRTSGCRLAKYDAFHPSVAGLFQKADEYRCHGKPNFVTTYDERPRVDKVALSGHGVAENDLQCTYHEIFPNISLPAPDESFFLGPEMALEFDRPLNKEFVLISCSTAAQPRYVFHQQFLLNPIRRKDVEERRRKTRQNTSHNLNVIVLGLDSVSYLNFDRHLPLTADFVRNRLHAFELHGYNKVGDNSFPNQCPLLTGRTSAETRNLSANNFFDDLDFIWKLYAQRGYRTMFLEDWPAYGIFNYLAKGFHLPPTDYYLRPVIMAMDASPLKTFLTGKLACLGPTSLMEILLDYLTRFANHMTDGPFYSYSFLVEATHDCFNSAGYTDAPLRRFFEEVERALNMTVLVFLSDHGMRFDNIRSTFIGKFEDRQPFAFVAFPCWFLDAYPDVKRNLMVNERRLTTPFDIHATLVELLDFPRATQTRTQHGLSLLHEIPDTRTCTDASIPHQWCSCVATDEDISLRDPLAASMAEGLVAQINAWLAAHPRKCYPFVLRNLLDITAVQSSQEEQRQNISHYWVTVEVSPSGAIFEATVRVNRPGGVLSILGDVSRCNFYYGESYCVRDHWMEKFCYCRRTYGIEPL